MALGTIMSTLARSRLTWAGVLLAGGLAAGAFFSADANPVAAQAVRDLGADAAAVRPYQGGALEPAGSVRKFGNVLVGYLQRDVADPQQARAHFASEFVRLGYVAVGIDTGPTIVRERFCRGTYQASVTTGHGPGDVSVGFTWGEGARCP